MSVSPSSIESEKNGHRMQIKVPSTPQYASENSPLLSPYIETLIAGLPTPRNLLQELDKVCATYRVSTKSYTNACYVQT